MYLNGAEEAAFAYRRISVNAYNSKEGNWISSLGKYHSDCCTRGSLMDAQVCGWKFEEKRDICIVSNCLSQVLTTKGKIGTLQCRHQHTAPWPRDQHISKERNGHHMLHDAGPRKGNMATCVIFLPQMHNLTWIMGKHQTNLNWEKLYKQWGCAFQKKDQYQERQRLRTCFIVKETKATWQFSEIHNLGLAPAQKIYKEHYCAVHGR